jgi:hypothetical protein
MSDILAWNDNINTILVEMKNGDLTEKILIYLDNLTRSLLV